MISKILRLAEKLGLDKDELMQMTVEEFAVHPNVFKKDLGVGEAIMIVPHERGAKTVRIKFSKTDDDRRLSFFSTWSLPQ